MPDSDTVVLDSPSEPQQVQLAVAGGEAVAYTRRDPLKESENEDTVAVIPYGPEAAILVVAASRMVPGVCLPGNALRSRPYRRWPNRCARRRIRRRSCETRF